MSKNRNAGFALTEVLVSVAVLGIIVAAIFSLVAPLTKLRVQTDTASGLTLITQSFRDCITSDNAWKNTLAEAANSTGFACLAAGNCANNFQAYIRLKSATDEDCIANYNTTLGATTGFTRDGVACNGYNDSSGMGSDLCPYRYNVWWMSKCPFGEANCPNPLVIVRGEMKYNPGPATLRDPDILKNLKRYTIFATRSRADETKYFALYEVKPEGTAGGPCPATGSVYRVWDRTQIVNPGLYVRDISADGTRVLIEPGTYNCSITVPGLGVGGHKAVLMNLSLPTPAPLIVGTSEYSPLFWGVGQTNSIIQGGFTVNTPTLVGVAQACTTPVDAGIQPYALGRPVGQGPELYSIMQCTVIARAAR